MPNKIVCLWMEHRPVKRNPCLGQLITVPDFLADVAGKHLLDLRISFQLEGIHPTQKGVYLGQCC